MRTMRSRPAARVRAEVGDGPCAARARRVMCRASAGSRETRGGRAWTDPTAAVSAGWSCVRRSPMRNQMTRAEEVEAVVSVAGRARRARDENPRDSLETRAVGAEAQVVVGRARRPRRARECRRHESGGRCAIADIGAVAFATLRGAREGVAGVAPGARADRTRRARYPRYAQLRSQHIIQPSAAHQRASGTRRRHRREDDEYLPGLASVPGGHCGAREWCTMVTTLTARCASLTSMASTPRRANLGARATRSVRRTGPRAMRRHPSHVTLAGSERDDSSPTTRAPTRPRPSASASTSRAWEVDTPTSRRSATARSSSRSSSRWPPVGGGLARRHGAFQEGRSSETPCPWTKCPWDS